MYVANNRLTDLPASFAELPMVGAGRGGAPPRGWGGRGGGAAGAVRCGPPKQPMVVRPWGGEGAGSLQGAGTF